MSVFIGGISDADVETWVRHVTMGAPEPPSCPLGLWDGQGGRLLRRHEARQHGITGPVIATEERGDFGVFFQRMVFNDQTARMERDQDGAWLGATSRVAIVRARDVRSDEADVTHLPAVPEASQTHPRTGTSRWESVIAKLVRSRGTLLVALSGSDNAEKSRASLDARLRGDKRTLGGRWSVKIKDNSLLVARIGAWDANGRKIK
jgi:hypothetical protein